MDPRFERETFIKNNLKINPTGTIASTSMFQGFLDENLLSKKGSLSNQKIVFQGGEKIEIIAKIENTEGVRNFESILQIAHGIMVARGDLGVEIHFKDIPSVQKHIIEVCNKAGKIL